MMQQINSTIYRGFVNKDLRVTYHYKFESTGQFQTITQRENGSITILPSFGISISEGFEKSRLFIPGNKYYPFSSLLRKSIKKISDNLYDIFPNVNRIEFEIDSRVLERFQTEQAMSTNNMTIIPEVWVDNTNSCYPAIKVNTLNGSISIPLEDAISISEMMNSFDPMTYGLSVLRLLGKLE